MCNNGEGRTKLNIGDQIQQKAAGRYLNPSDINLPAGYQIEAFAEKLDAPSCMTFDESGNLIVAESGNTSGNARIYRMRDGKFGFVADGFRAPVTGLSCIHNNIYVSHKCHIAVIEPDGTIYNIISGLPSSGDYGNSNVVLGSDNKIYWGQGTVTNSGVVGPDNSWVYEYSSLHDIPGSYILLNGQNFKSGNMLIMKEEPVSTGAFSPFGVPNLKYEVRKSEKKATGSILRANTDGTGLELVAWGLRYPCRIRFDYDYRLFAANQGFDDRGSRPIANAPDELLQIRPGLWYGWPDFAGGEPVTLSKFKPEGGKQPEFLITNHPNAPLRPFAVFPPYSGIRGFDFNYNAQFGSYGDVYIAESGGTNTVIDKNITPYAGFGHRISKVDINTGEVITFAINKSGLSAGITKEGGFGCPVDMVFGPDGAMYVLDYGFLDGMKCIPYSGVIWRITKTS